MVTVRSIFFLFGPIKELHKQLPAALVPWWVLPVMGGGRGSTPAFHSIIIMPTANFVGIPEILIAEIIYYYDVNGCG